MNPLKKMTGNEQSRAPLLVPPAKESPDDDQDSDIIRFGMISSAPRQNEWRLEPEEEATPHMDMEISRKGKELSMGHIELSVIIYRGFCQSCPSTNQELPAPVVSIGRRRRDRAIDS